MGDGGIKIQNGQGCKPTDKNDKRTDFDLHSGDGGQGHNHG